MAPLLQLGIVGHPLGHTLSPVLHQYLMENLDIKGEYLAYDTPPDKLEETILYLKTLGIRGVNVTIPHKVNVMTCVQDVDAVAKRAGAVNTLVFEGSGDASRIYGYNTDVAGFIRGVPPKFLGRIEDAHVLVLGAGGAARAVVMGLLENKVKAITLSARSQARAAVVLNAAKQAKRQLKAESQIAWLALEELEDLRLFDWVVNATSVGMRGVGMEPDMNASPLSAEQITTIKSGALVYDLIYKPAQTKLLALSAERGLDTRNGLDMLMHQGVQSFELWSGKRVPLNLLAPLREVLSAASLSGGKDKPEGMG